MVSPGGRQCYARSYPLGFPAQAGGNRMNAWHARRGHRFPAQAGIDPRKHLLDRNSPCLRGWTRERIQWIGIPRACGDRRWRVISRTGFPAPAGIDRRRSSRETDSPRWRGEDFRNDPRCTPERGSSGCGHSTSRHVDLSTFRIVAPHRAPSPAGPCSLGFARAGIAGVSGPPVSQAACNPFPDMVQKDPWERCRQTTSLP